MNRRLIIGVSLLMAFTVPSHSEAGNPIAGATCSKIGEIKVYKGNKFTCTKSGKKRIWNKGIKIAASNPSPTPSATPTKEKELTQYEKNLLAFQTTARKSYDLIRQQWPNSHSNISIEYHYTDNFPRYWLDRWKVQAEKSINFFNQLIEKPEIFHIYFVTEKDLHFMEKFGIWNDENTPSHFKYWESNTDLQNCEGAAAWYLTRKGDNSPSLQGGIAIASNAYTDRLLKECRSIITHESFHAVQDYFLTSKLGNTGFGPMDSYDQIEMPTFREGSAETISYALGQDTYSDAYQAFFERFHQFVLKSNEIKNLKTQADVIKYMKIIENRSATPDAHDASYLMGMTFYEYLIPQYGLEKFLDLVRTQNREITFRMAFQRVYGITIDKAYEEAASHILNALYVLRF